MKRILHEYVDKPLESEGVLCFTADTTIATIIIIVILNLTKKKKKKKIFSEIEYLSVSNIYVFFLKKNLNI